MAAASNVTKQIIEIVECSICSETFANSRILPCGHSYCLKCIELYGKDKRPGEQLSCPLCRIEFTVPTGGLSELPKNFLIDRVCEVSRPSITTPDDTTPRCDLCLDVDEFESSAATSRCLDCQQHLCALCTERHKKQTFASNHNIVQLAREPDGKPKRNTPSYCKEHPNEHVTLFCYICKSVICNVCHASSHNAHRCADVNEAAEELDKQLRENAENAAEMLSKVAHRVEQLLSERDDFAALVLKIEHDITAKSEELKHLVDEHTGRLLQELDETNVKTSTEIERLRQQMEVVVGKLENIHRYIDEVRRCGSSADVCRAADVIEVKTKELLTSHLDDIRRPNLSFVSTDLSHKLEIANSNIVGTIVQGHSSSKGTVDIKSLSPTLEHTMTARVAARVFGVTSLAGCVYVARESQSNIDVHDSNSFSPLRQMTITPSLDPVDIKSCVINQCLYISDYNGCRVHRVPLTGTATSWEFPRRPDGLSVTGSGNVVVCFPEEQKMAEYKPDGSCVLEVSLQEHGAKPTHAIRLDVDTFVVCDSLYGHCTTTGVRHRIFTCWMDGDEINIYGNLKSGSRSGELCYPWHLANDQEGNVLVADYTNARIVLLSRSLTYIRDLIPRTKLPGLPCRLYLDVANRRLLVGLDNGKVFVYKLA